ncbi:Trypsin-like protease [Dirofilaria immitis]
MSLSKFLFLNFLQKSIITFSVPLNAVACVAQSYDIIPNTFILYSRGSDPTRMKKVTSLAKINVTRIACIQEKSIPQDQICTSEMQKSNMCSGDSGSGLMFKAVNGSWNIVGIASAGTDCRMINMAINLRKEPSNVFQLDGSIFIDVRAHNDFICQYSGLCFGEQLKNRQKIKAILL